MRVIRSSNQRLAKAIGLNLVSIQHLRRLSLLIKKMSKVHKVCPNMSQEYP